MKTVSIVTLGCKVNYTDSQDISEKLAERGYTVFHKINPSDLVIVNGCTVTSKADYQTRQSIRRANRELPGVPVVVIGCGANVHPEVMRSAGDVASVLSGSEAENICDVVSSLIGNPQVDGPKTAVNGRTRAFLKIQEGCNSFCTYCIVPHARGRERSIEIDEVLHRVEGFIGGGFLELVLVGINLGRYGYNTGCDRSEVNLAVLLETMVERYPGLRIRISSIEPMDLTDELVSVVSRLNNIAPHLHIPLQSGDDSILKSMGRPYTADMFVDRVNGAVKRIAEERGNGIRPALGVDVMVGFPGEGDEQFENTVELLKSLPATYLHVFPYSLRPNTPASEMKGQVRGDLKRARAKRLRELDAEMRSDYLELNFGRELRVLGEIYEDGLLTGKSENYLTVSYPGVHDEINSFLEVKIKGSVENGLYGERADRT